MGPYLLNIFVSVPTDCSFRCLQYRRNKRCLGLESKERIGCLNLAVVRRGDVNMHGKQVAYKIRRHSGEH